MIENNPTKEQMIAVLREQAKQSDVPNALEFFNLYYLSIAKDEMIQEDYEQLLWLTAVEQHLKIPFLFDRLEEALQRTTVLHNAPVTDENRALVDLVDACSAILFDFQFILYALGKVPKPTPSEVASYLSATLENDWRTTFFGIIGMLPELWERLRNEPYPQSKIKKST